MPTSVTVIGGDAEAWPATAMVIAAAPAAAAKALIPFFRIVSLLNTAHGPHGPFGPALHRPCRRRPQATSIYSVSRALSVTATGLACDGSAATRHAARAAGPHPSWTDLL